ncbi:MAG: diaminopimelate decarboxylase [Candidatus Avispirillum sp.]
MISENIGTNSAGRLTFAGRDTVELCEKYGTPLMLMDEERIRENCRVYKSAMSEFMGGESRPLFAGKSCCFRQLYRIMAEEGMCADIVSPGELYTANSAGFPMERAFFHGNNKTDADIAYAMDCGMGHFIVDNEDELYAVAAEAGRRGKVQDILLRLTPGIDPHTQAKISTGKVDSKFGVAIETGQALEFCRKALSLENVRLKGFHCHIGSQIFEYKPFSDAADIMLRFIKKLRDELGYTAQLLNLGGGFGVPYVESDPKIDYRENIKGLAGEISQQCAALDIPQPDILMEPGRSIVADSGMTLYTVGSVKTISGYKSYVSIDGGMTDNPRFALYGSAYTVYVAERPNDAADFRADVAGRCCESGDIIQEDVPMPKPARGEHIAVAVTGAYNYSMASNYNRIPRPPVVMLKGDGTEYTAVRRESYEDLCRNEL